MPKFDAYESLTADQAQWLGRADAIVKNSFEPSNYTEWIGAMRVINSPARLEALEIIRLVLYRALGAAELEAPASAKGTFIPVGAGFDAFAAMSKLLRTSSRDVLIVDPYMDDTMLTDYGGIIADGVTLRLLSDEANHKASLTPAALAYSKQFGATRPLAVRLAAARSLHDRLIIVDQATSWIITQSIKDFAKRSPGEIVRGDDTAALKIPHYEAVWNTAQVVV
jgi:hypothetical protein